MRALKFKSTRWVAGAVIAAAAVVAAFSGAAAAHGSGAGSPADGRSLPLGDGRFADQPTRGAVLVCSPRFPGGGGAHRVGGWIRDGRWWPAEKPVVEGEVAWPDARIAVTIEGGERVVRANRLPTHVTGTFPIRPGSAASDYDRNPNSITASEVLLRLPGQPQAAAMPGCVPLGMIGFALSGAPIFNAFDLQGRDAPAYEVQDRCNGHPEPDGAYHYHHWSACLTDAAGDAGRHSDVVGFVLDGFPIHGPRGEGGRAVVNADLDECHGHTYEIELDGVQSSRYHYHFTAEYPYTIGCFKGSVDASLLRRAPPPARPGRPPPPSGR